MTSFGVLWQMKVVSVVDTRPEFIRAASVGKALRAAGHTEVLVHTGQHYDSTCPSPPWAASTGSGDRGRG